MDKSEREITTALKRTALFRAAATATLARLASQVALLDVPRGKLLCRSGERWPGLYLVASGRVMQSVGAPRGVRKVIDLVGPGGYFGLAAAIHGAPEIVTVETLADSALLLVPREALLDCAAEDAGLGRQLMAALSREVCGLVTDIEAMSLHSGRARVANYLLQFADAARARSITLPAKKSLIASRLNLTPEYFSRMLHDMIADGTIAVSGRQIAILDPGRLRQRGAEAGSAGG